MQSVRLRVNRVVPFKLLVLLRFVKMAIVNIAIVIGVGVVAAVMNGLAAAAVIIHIEVCSATRGLVTDDDAGRWSSRHGVDMGVTTTSCSSLRCVWELNNIGSKHLYQNGGGGNAYIHRSERLISFCAKPARQRAQESRSDGQRHHDTLCRVQHSQIFA